MGFGYVFIGYLMSFLLEMTVRGLGIFGAAELLGYSAMFVGLFTLSLYHSDFKGAKWSLIPLMFTAAYSILSSFADLFAWDLGILGGETVKNIFSWVSFFLIMFFQVALLYGIRMISESVELKQITIKAVRNSVFVGFYALLYVMAKCMPEGASQYLVLSITKIYA